MCDSRARHIALLAHTYYSRPYCYKLVTKREEIQMTRSSLS